MQSLTHNLICFSHNQVREAVGVRRTIISGGGSLAAHLDDFYEAAGVAVLNGWGMTETSPVLACRQVTQVSGWWLALNLCFFA